METTNVKELLEKVRKELQEVKAIIQEYRKKHEQFSTGENNGNKQ